MCSPIFFFFLKKKFFFAIFGFCTHRAQGQRSLHKNSLCAKNALYENALEYVELELVGFEGFPEFELCIGYCVTNN